MADPSPRAHTTRRARIEAIVYATFAALHAPGAAVALTQPTPTAPSTVLAAASVLGSLVLWGWLAVLATLAARRSQQVPRGLLAAALAADTVVLTISGLSPPRMGNITAAAVGLIAICAAAALLTRPRLLPIVLVPAVVGQTVLLHAADAATTSARLVADVATVTLASAATAALIAWLEHDRRAGQAALARAALTDPLTGLLNRRGLAHGLPALVGSASGEGATRRYRRRAGDRRGEEVRSTGVPARVHVVVIDIDHFKSVNDRRGHDVGDEVLVLVGQALRDCARAGDLLVRLGGEELGWVARWRTPQDAAGAIEHLRVVVSEKTGDFGEPVTISAGIAAMADPGEGHHAALPDFGAVLRETMVLADRALYRAKGLGRDRVEVIDEGGWTEPVPASE